MPCPAWKVQGWQETMRCLGFSSSWLQMAGGINFFAGFHPTACRWIVKNRRWLTNLTFWTKRRIHLTRARQAGTQLDWSGSWTSKWETWHSSSRRKYLLLTSAVSRHRPHKQTGHWMKISGQLFCTKSGQADLFRVTRTHSNLRVVPVASQISYRIHVDK